MIDAGRGKIIFTSSVLGFRGGTNVAGYTATKTALVGLTKALANEWAPLGVNVNAIAPRIIDTPANREMMPKADSGKWVPPERIAVAMCFLCSDAAASINGARLAIYGAV